MSGDGASHEGGPVGTAGDAGPSGAARPDLSADYFVLFDQPRAFAIDEGALAARFRKLQGLTHPDRFAAASPVERRWSVQASSFVNDGFETLRRPLKRATYLLTLAGISVDEETDTAMDPGFLMQQMELRESLESVASSSDPQAALQRIESELAGARAAEADGFEAASRQSDWVAARHAVRRWQFLDKLGQEADDLGARLDDD